MFDINMGDRSSWETRPGGRFEILESPILVSNAGSLNFKIINPVVEIPRLEIPKF